jgi:hypothetical protein
MRRLKKLLMVFYYRGERFANGVSPCGSILLPQRLCPKHGITDWCPRRTA